MSIENCCYYCKSCDICDNKNCLVNKQKAEIEQLTEELEEKNTYEEKLNSMIDNLRDDISEQKVEIERLKKELANERNAVITFQESANAHRLKVGEVIKQNAELQKQVDELKGGKGLFISQDQIDWVCNLGVMVHIKEDSPVVLLNRHKYEKTCADTDRRIFHFEEEKEQAIKDTAKEIEKELENKGYFEYGQFIINGNDFIEIFKKRGAEVE